MVVDQTSESIMEAALLLGATDPKVREFYHQARNFQYSDELLEQIDKAIAGHDLHRDGEEDLLGSSHDPEALLLASLLGDKEAEAELDRTKSLYDNNYQEDRDTVQRKYQEFFNEPGRTERIARDRETLGPLKVDDLVAVHATRFYPKYEKESGKWKMETHFDATSGKVPRTSLHFALNHVVQSHMYGNWDETPFVIVTPLADLMRENGVPDKLNTVDTYWNLNPGEDLSLPENSWVLAPGRTEGKMLAKGSSRDTLKHKGPDKSAHKVNYPLYNTAKLQDLKRSVDYNVLYGGEEGPEWDEQRELNRQLDEETEKLVENRDQSVKKLIESLGFEPKPGGQWAWGGSWDVTAQTQLLAEDLGTKTGSHDVEPEASIQEFVSNYLSNLREGKQDKRLVRDQLKLYWPELEAQQRRMLWTMGLV